MKFFFMKSVPRCKHLYHFEKFQTRQHRMHRLGRFRLEIVIPPETVYYSFEALLIKDADSKEKQAVGSSVVRQTCSEQLERILRKSIFVTSLADSPQAAFLLFPYHVTCNVQCMYKQMALDKTGNGWELNEDLAMLCVCCIYWSCG